MFLTAGRLSTRLAIAGALLVVGLPALTILVYVWGYPAAVAPLPLVVLVDGLQVLIVLNALVVVVQLIARAGVRRPLTSGRETQPAEARKAPLLHRRIKPVELREMSLSLAAMIWEHERNGGVELCQAVLDYIRDAVTTEVELRRRRQALERRWIELQAVLAERPGVEAPDRLRR